MKHNPLISIITPTFNRAHIIIDTLNSVVNQTYDNWECIVVDDGSEDNTKEVVQSFIDKSNKFKYYLRPKNLKKGPSACRNYGVSISSGSYLIFLDSDDILSPKCLQRRIQVMQNDKNLDFAVFSMGHFKNVDEPFLDKKRSSIKLEKELAIKSYLHYKFLWNTTRPIFKKEFLLLIKGFDEDLEVFTDPNLSLRILLNNCVNYKVIDETDCYYRIENSYKSNRSSQIYMEKVRRNYIKFLSKLMDNFSESEIITYKNDLKYNCFHHIRDFSNLNISPKTVINLLDSKVKLTFKEKLYLYFLPQILKRYKITGANYFYNKIKSYFVKVSNHNEILSLHTNSNI